ncbi:hypothetical protein I546_3933 [Mycobacterium kansasii 732]|uniref:Uncharacterized protein n=1 Tax=Mycobacterium pseudokansasii TaxID=2341080 RepID=A0A498QX10_9MYCO|nr:hypothetical protein [Mycobacterium pseudokansasii]EUA10027.1 hypothetical protein I546_3933 [Mycobacterium kansasii 732]VBA50768.1 hypothetical protein LAUMK142_02809 [Mycobacterium pseudokansasii]
MGNSDDVFPDDVPVADAVEQLQPTGDSPSDDLSGGSDGADPPWSQLDDVPLETTAYDWQEQRETVLMDDELDEPLLTLNATRLPRRAKRYPAAAAG